MRIFKTPNLTTNPQALWREILSEPGAASATPDLVKALNTHVNLSKDVPPNTVLLIPEAADLNDDAGSSLGGDELDELADMAGTALKAIAARSAAGLKQADADHAAVASAVKVAATKRLVETDPELKKRLDAADAAFKADQKRAKEVQSELADLHKAVAGEFAKLRKTLVR